MLRNITNPKDFAYHSIYETIAPHFSSTRYKPWPLIPAFLGTIPAGSLGADLGCGNGKYLPIRSTLALQRTDSDGSRDGNSLLTVGVDRSSNLVGLARDNFGMLDASDASESKRRQEVAVGDAIHSSLRTGLFDYAISIATIHHFSTWERRRASVQELIRLIAPVDAATSASGGGSESSIDPRLEGGFGPGRFMIFVWALEQKDEGKRQFQATDPTTLKTKPEIDDPNHVKSKDRLVSYSGLEAGDGVREVTDDQDVLVPWVLTTAKAKVKQPRNQKTKQSQAKGTTEELTGSVARMNVNTKPKAEETEDVSRPVYNRYYHMFRAGELEALVADAGATMSAVHQRERGGVGGNKIEVVKEASGWERGNWWGVWRVQWTT